MEKNTHNEKKYTFTWKIFNFGFLTQKKDEWIESPVFIAKSLEETSWRMLLYPRGDEESEIDEMTCFLMRSKDCGGPLEINCEYKIELLNGNRILLCKTGSDIFKKGTRQGYDISKKPLTPVGSQFLDDTWTFKCHLISKLREPVLRSESIGSTTVNIEQCSFNWNVKNLNSNCLDTVKFPYTGSSQLEMTVEAPEDDIKITIRRLNLVKPQQVLCRMTLLDLNGKKQDSKQATHLFETEDNRNESDTWEFPVFLKKSKLNSEKEIYVKDDSFTLQCEISVSNGTVTSEIENKANCDSETIDTIPRVKNFSALKSDMKRMYKDKIQTDVELIVDKKVFPAHKCVLSSRSPVFLAMFSQDMVENQSGRVEISDLDVKTLDILLLFMYTGAVKEMDSEMAAKLLLAADKYQVLTLKEECSKFLRSELTDLSVCQVLDTSDLINDKPLREAAVSFIKKHSKRILKTYEWKLFVEKNLTLATDVIWEISAMLAEDNK